MTAALTITLPAPLAEEVRAAARERGVAPEEYVRQRIATDLALGANTDQLDDDDVEADLVAAADFEHTGMGVPWDEVRAWMTSWGSANELPRPIPRKLR